ncbi:DUF1569 domain-containing protein [Hyunsoonleella aestuarii]|uniref:DUF1569 domain-containing protein n=1 Tax=Hyunsoonleella aestuarii TaxID=912802 RepID=A0ABP8EAH3_9FLAO|nr:DUF1569 domain-containing protein [Hyunsoonleella aestuarii]
MSGEKIKVLSNLFTQIEESIPFKDKRNSNISKSDVGWQLDHTLKVMNAVSGVLIKTDPNKYKSDINFMRLILFPLGYIPRGKAKAPKIVQPPEVINTSDLNNQLQQAHQYLEMLKPLPKKSHFIHHVFGMLSKKQTLRFLEIHTKHHLKIVKDILAN